MDSGVAGGAGAAADAAPTDAAPIVAAVLVAAALPAVNATTPVLDAPASVYTSVTRAAVPDSSTSFLNE
ncbi:unnamed protein product, partial [Closterium sp. NIES-54]